MIKKKAKKRKTTKKATKTQSKPEDKKEPNPTEVRKDISILVESQAKELAEAVIGVGMTGQLAPVKFLFEIAKIFPTSTDGSQATHDEDSLAQTLLERLNIPTSPVVHDERQKEEEEDEDVVVIPARVVEAKQESAEDRDEEQKEVLAGCE